MRPPALHTAALSALEGLINRALALDPGTRARLRELDGHSFRLDCTSPTLSAIVRIDGDYLELGSRGDADTTTALSGSLAEFSKIALADDPAAALINGDVQVSGDTGPLLELRDMLAGLDIDWEQPLAQLFGDVAAHQIGRGLRAGQRFALQALSQFRRQLGEFIVEESELVPHPLEAEDFYRDVEQLATRGERLEARVQRLAQRLKEQSQQEQNKGDSGDDV